MVLIHMLLEIQNRAEGEFALNAFERVVDLMHVLDVLDQVSLLGETTRTYLTLKRLFPRVQCHMLFQSHSRMCLMRTNVTRIGLIDHRFGWNALFMHRQQMLVESASGNGLVLAIWTLIRLLFVANSQ